MNESDTGEPQGLGPWGLLKKTIVTWLADDALHWGASLAYYSMISLAPLVILAMAVLGRMVGRGQAEEWVLEQVGILSGPRGADLARTVMEQAGGIDFSSVGAVLTVLLLLFGATAVFTNLQGSLNQIWEVESKSSILRTLIRTRISAFLMILALAMMILISVLVSTGLNWLGPLLDPLEQVLPTIKIADVATSLILLWLFVAAAFWVLPDVKISFRDVWVGALATAGLLVVGKLVLASFLAENAFASMYGTAGSILLVLMWVYYSAQVFLLGAVFTKVWSRTRGRGIDPETYATRVKSVKVEKDGAGEESLS